MKDVSVIIVSYNVRYYLEQCLLSVIQASEGLDVEILVPDNDSPDDSVGYLEPLFPSVRFIRTGGNLGFSKANNLALKQSVGRYVLFLNPDTIISGSMLRDCVDFMDSHPKAGGAGVMMLNADGSFALESRRSVPTPFVSFCKMSGLGTLFPKSRLFGRYYMDYLDRERASRIEVISGAAMFVRHETLDQTGGFDEDFFMYGEDVDLSYRILKAGWENWYIPTRMLHYKGESTNKTSYRYAQVFYDAMLIFFRKHFSNLSGFFAAVVKSVIFVKKISTYLANNVLYRNASTEVSDNVLANCVLFDASCTTYSQMLDVMTSEKEGRKIAIYYPNKELLITDRLVRQPHKLTTK